MYGRGFKYARKKIVPKSLDLHVLPAYKTEVYEHIQTNQKLDYAPCMFVFPDEQEYSQRNGQTDIAEVEKIEQIIFRQPKRHGNGLKNDKKDDRM